MGIRDQGHATQDQTAQVQRWRINNPFMLVSIIGKPWICDHACGALDGHVVNPNPKLIADIKFWRSFVVIHPKSILSQTCVDYDFVIGKRHCAL